MLDSRTLAFAEYPGNRQFITSGNLAENARAFLFLMDYANARRLKLWGDAKVAAEPELLARLAAPDGIAVDQALVFMIDAMDWNCSQYIPRLVAEATAYTLLWLNCQVGYAAQIHSPPPGEPRGEKWRQAGVADFSRSRLHVVRHTKIRKGARAVVIERIAGGRIAVARLADRADHRDPAPLPRKRQRDTRIRIEGRDLGRLAVIWNRAGRCV